ncbi:MAG: hypothetical protein E5X64_33475, partial [Mesorhizobium sp.]
RGVPAWHRRRSVQHPSSGSALRADPPSPTRGEGRAAAPSTDLHPCCRQSPLEAICATRYAGANSTDRRDK